MGVIDAKIERKECETKDILILLSATLSISFLFSLFLYQCITSSFNLIKDAMLQYFFRCIYIYIYIYIYIIPVHLPS